MRNAPDSAAPMRSVEEVKAMLDTTEKGGVRNSIRNCLTVFQYDPLLTGALAYNLLTDRTDLVNPIGCQPAWGFEVDDIGGNSGGSVTTKEQARVCWVDKAHDPYGNDQHAQNNDRNVDATL